MMKIKAALIFTIVILSACTVTTTKEYIHKETSDLRRASSSGGEAIQLDQPVMFIPQFRTFAWNRPSRPMLIILSEQPTKVFIESVRLVGPNGSPDQTIEISSMETVEKKRIRQTNIKERMSTGGVFKGQRVADTNIYERRVLLPFEPEKFNTSSHLLLEVVASIEEEAAKTYRFKLDYRERRHLDYITR